MPGLNLCSVASLFFSSWMSPFASKKKKHECCKYRCQSQRLRRELHSHVKHITDLTSPVVLMGAIKHRKQFTTHLSSLKDPQDKSVSMAEGRDVFIGLFLLAHKWGFFHCINTFTQVLHTSTTFSCWCFPRVFRTLITFSPVRHCVFFTPLFI